MAIVLLMGIMLSPSLFAQETHAQKIIALSPHSVELLYALGVGQRIIATTEHADYPESALKIERIGGYHGLQIERIVELQPDLIVAWQGGNRAQDLDKLEDLGLNVYRSKTQSLYGILDELNVLAKKTGRETQAQQLAQAFTQKLRKLEQRYRSEKSISFFYQLWQQPLRTMASGSWINDVFELCGGQNIIDSKEGISDYPQVSLENVILKSPEAIFIPSDHGKYSQKGDIWQKWQLVPAVKNNHVFFMDGDLLHRFSLRIVEGAQQVCDKLNYVRQTIK